MPNQCRGSFEARFCVNGGDALSDTGLVFDSGLGASCPGCASSNEGTRLSSPEGKLILLFVVSIEIHSSFQLQKVDVQ
jgi:hypothetical protein